MWKRMALLSLVAAGATGCGGSDGDSNELDGGATPAADSGASLDARASARGDAAVVGSDVALGDFSLQLVAPVPASETTTATDGYTALLGKIFDGAAAETTIWEKQSEADGCTLLTPRVPFCDPACAGQVCVEDNVCRAAPTAIGVGDLTVQGATTLAGSSELTIKLGSGKTTYQAAGDSALKYPAFAEGDPIRFALTGDHGTGPFTLSTEGIAQLALSEQNDYARATGKPLSLAWTAAEKNLTSRIQVKVDLSHHGGSKGKIECDVEDDGSLIISASIMDTLTGLGLAGFPSVTVTRSSTDTVSTPIGSIRLNVYSYAEHALQVPGLVSCSDDTDCPTGQSCADDLTCS